MSLFAWLTIVTDNWWDIRDLSNVSGAIYHVEGISEEMAWFGTTPGTVKLLDGVFLAARVKTLRGNHCVR